MNITRKYPEWSTAAVINAIIVQVHVVTIEMVCTLCVRVVRCLYVGIV